MKRLIFVGLLVLFVRWALKPREPYDPTWDLPYIPTPDERASAQRI